MSKRSIEIYAREGNGVRIFSYGWFDVVQKFVGLDMNPALS
jgi:hypothetical protein